MGQVEIETLRGEESAQIRFRVNRRARRYILRVARDGFISVTIPRFGSKRAGLALAEQHTEWIRTQIEKARAQKTDRAWKPGTSVLVEGELVEIRLVESGVLREVWLGDCRMAVSPAEGHDLRPLIEAHLWEEARRLLTERVAELSARENLAVRRVSIRNQRSRWGSCSRRGTISLNWRLIQTPGFVRDYIILHELAHMRHMNHSDAFWAEVRRMCPEYLAAEGWLKSRRGLLR